MIPTKRWNPLLPLNKLYYPTIKTLHKDNYEKQNRLEKVVYDDSPYIYRGYRAMPIRNVVQSFLSIFSLHNETMNIWTHGIPLVIWIYYMINYVFLQYNMYTSTAVFLSMVFYLSCACICMLFSTIYHTFKHENYKAYHVCLGCDIEGISFLLMGTNTLYLTLMWQDHLSARLHIGLQLFNLSVGAYLAAWIPKMVREKLSLQRTIYFSVYATYLYVAQYIAPPGHDDAFAALLAIGPWIGVGLAIKSLKVPERFFPFVFDYYLSSHQIFHLFSAMSIYVSFWGAYKFCQETSLRVYLTSLQ